MEYIRDEVKLNTHLYSGEVGVSLVFFAAVVLIVLSCHGHLTALTLLFSIFFEVEKIKYY